MFVYQGAGYRHDIMWCSREVNDNLASLALAVNTLVNII